MHLEIHRLGLAYGGKRIVSGVDLRLEQGQIGCLLGPSGCGKTSVLRAVAGFEPVSEGEIRLNGQCVSRPGQTLPPERRRIGMVFQDLALFPHLSAADNVAFGLRRLDGAERRQRVQELLSLVGLADVAARFPHQLSGGQQQRIALARALAPRPDLLLLDEPFSSIDSTLREQLAREVRAILKREGTTAILVTHEQNEAFAMADAIGVMRQGRIEQWDHAYNLYHRPATRFVADFIGLGVLLPGLIREPGAVDTELGLLCGAGAQTFRTGQAVEILIRPDDVQHDDASVLKVEVRQIQFRGAEYLYGLRLPSGQSLLCFAPSHHQHVLGEPIGIRLELQHLVMFPR